MSSRIYKYTGPKCINADINKNEAIITFYMQENTKLKDFLITDGNHISDYSDIIRGMSQLDPYHPGYYKVDLTIESNKFNHNNVQVYIVEH